MALRDSLHLDIAPYLQALKRAEERYAEFRKVAQKEAQAIAGEMERAGDAAGDASAAQTRALRAFTSDIRRVSKQAADDIRGIREQSRLGIIDTGTAERQIRQIQMRVAGFVRSVGRDLGTVPEGLRTELTGALDAVGVSLERSGEQTTKVTSRARRSWEHLTSSVESMGGRMRMAIVGAMLAIGLSIERTLSSSLRYVAEFDQAMTDSLAIMGGRTQELDRAMEETAKSLAVSLGFSPAEVAAGYEYLALAGYNAAEALEYIGSMAEFARAGNFDLAVATDLATDALSALGLASEDTGENAANLERVMNALIAASTTANASTEQFSESLIAGTAPALRRVGKDLEEGLALLAVFADRGIKGAAAGEQVNIMLRDLPRALGRNAEKFRSFGLDLVDAEGNLRALADVVEELDRVLATMSDTQKAVTLEQLGLTRGVGDAISTVSGGAETIRQYEAAIRGAGDVMREVSEERMTAFNRRLEAMTTRFKLVVADRIGVPAMERLGAVIDHVNNNFERYEGTLVGLIQVVTGLVGAFLIAKTAQISFNLAVGAGRAIVATYRAAVLLMVAAKNLLTLNTGRATAAMVLFSRAVAANPIGLAVTAIMAAAGAWLAFRNRTDEATEALKRLEEQHRETMAEISKAGGAELVVLEAAAESRRVVAANALRDLDEQITAVEEVSRHLRSDEGREEFLEGYDDGPLGRALGRSQYNRRLDYLLSQRTRLMEQREPLAQEEAAALAEVESVQQRINSEAATALAYYRARVESVENEIALLDEDDDRRAEGMRELEEYHARITDIEAARAALRETTSEAGGTVTVDSSEIQAASIQMLAKAEEDLLAVREKDMTSLERRAQALRRQAALDGAHRAALLEKAEALEAVSEELQRAEAQEAVAKLREQLLRLTGEQSEAYADELKRLRELRAEHPALAEELDALIERYEALSEAQAAGEGVDRAAQAATLRHAAGASEETREALQRALLAQQAYWRERASEAAEGSEEEVAALQRVAQATEALRGVMSGQEQEAEALAEARRVLADADAELGISANAVRAALERLDAAWHEASTDAQRQQIAQLMHALQALGVVLERTRTQQTSFVDALEQGFRHALPGAIAAFAEVAGEALAGLSEDTATFGEAIVQILVDVAKQIASLLIALGTAELFIPGLQGSGFGKIAAGTALMAAASAAGAVVRRGQDRRRDREQEERAPATYSGTYGGSYATGGLVVGPEQIIRVNEAGEEFVVPASQTRRYLAALEAMRAGAPPAAVADRVLRAASIGASAQAARAGRAGRLAQTGAHVAQDARSASASMQEAAEGLAGATRAVGALIGKIPSRLTAEVSTKRLVFAVEAASAEVNATLGPRE